MKTYRVQIDAAMREHNEIVVLASLLDGKKRVVTQSYGYPLDTSHEEIQKSLEQWAVNYAYEEEMRKKNEEKNRREDKAEKTIQKLREVYNVKN